MRYQATPAAVSRCGKLTDAQLSSAKPGREYPTRSPFNWRTSMLLSVLARMPDRVAHGALVLLGVALLMATVRVTATEPLPTVVACGILQAGVEACDERVEVQRVRSPGTAFLGYLLCAR